MGKKRRRRKRRRRCTLENTLIYSVEDVEMCVMCVRDKYHFIELDSYLSGIFNSELIVESYFFYNSYDNFRYIQSEK